MTCSIVGHSNDIESLRMSQMGTSFFRRLCGLFNLKAAALPHVLNIGRHGYPRMHPLLVDRERGRGEA